jgi:hypothetical protein
MWQELNLVPESIPAAADLIAGLQATRSNGGAVFACFRYTKHPVLDWFIRATRLTPPAFDFASELLAQPIVSSRLPELNIAETLAEPLAVQVLDCFDLEASLAQHLFYGGAYHRIYGGVHHEAVTTSRRAKTLAGEFVDAVEGQITTDWFAFSEQAWSPWFHEVAWDATWIGLSPARRLIWVLCATDSD